MYEAYKLLYELIQFVCGRDFQETFALLTLLMKKLVIKTTKKSQINLSQGRIEPAIVVRDLIYPLSYRLNPMRNFQTKSLTVDDYI
jgi:hypothetical protein